MTIRNYTHLMLLMAAMTASLSLTSCKDDDKDQSNNGGNEKSEEQYEQELLGWNVITQLTGQTIAPDGWESMTFDPTIGTAKEGDPYTRIVATNDMETAASRFSALIGQPSLINETTVGYNYNLEGVGSLVYQRGSENSEYLAQVTVDVKQTPRLKKILYMTPEQMGNNGNFTGSAYYRFGDVVSKKNSDGLTEYWICVRPAIGQEGKEESHWVTISELPTKNIYSYSKNGSSWYLPTGLGTNTEHMQSFVDMLFAMLRTDTWVNGVAGKKNYFGDLRSAKSYRYHDLYFWGRVNQAWMNLGLYDKIFGPYETSMADLTKSLSGTGISLLYEGYHWKWGWEPKLVQGTYTLKDSQMHTVEWTKPQKNVQNLNIDFRNPKACNGPFFDNDKKARFIIRHAKGSEMAGKNYSVKTSLGKDYTDVYVYNRYFYQSLADMIYDLSQEPEDLTPKKGYYQIGDMIKDNQGHVWICIQPAGSTEAWTTIRGYVATDKAWFVCFDPDIFKLSDHMDMSFNNYAYNTITSEQVTPIGYVMTQLAYNAVWQHLKSKQTVVPSGYLSVLNDIIEFARVDFSKMFTLRDSSYVNASGNSVSELTACTTFAVSDECSRNLGQRLVRFMMDGTYSKTNDHRDWVYRTDTHYKKTIDSNDPHGYTDANMFLGELTKRDKVEQYAREEWTYTKYWSAEADKRSSPRTTIESQSFKLKDYFWYPAFKGFESNKGSMYNEPIIFCCLKSVYDNGEQPTKFVFNDNIETPYVPYHLVNNSYLSGKAQRNDDSDSWGTAYWQSEYAISHFQNNGEELYPPILQ